MPSIIMDNVPADESGAAVGLNGMMRSIGTTSASAAIAMVLAGSTVTVAGHDYPDQSAFRWCFLIGAAASYIGFLIALLILAAANKGRKPCCQFRIPELTATFDAPAAGIGTATTCSSGILTFLHS